MMEYEAADELQPMDVDEQLQHEQDAAMDDDNMMLEAEEDEDDIPVTQARKMTGVRGRSRHY